jgi:hypothetical protein
MSLDALLLVAVVVTMDDALVTCGLGAAFRGRRRDARRCGTHASWQVASRLIVRSWNTRRVREYCANDGGLTKPS